MLVTPIIYFLMNCKNNLSKYYISLFLPLLNEFIISSESPIEQIIHQYVILLFIRETTEHEITKDIIAYLSKLLLSRPNDIRQRLLYMKMYMELLKLIPESERELYCDEITKTIFEFIKREGNETIQKLGYYAIGKWMKVNPEKCSIKSEFDTFISKPIKSNSPQSLLPLITLSSIYENTQSNSELQKDLLSIFRKGIESPITHIYIGWLSIIHLIDSDNEDIWNLINDPNSYLYNDRLYQYSKSKEECKEFEYIWISICDIINIISKKYYSKLSLNSCNEIPHPLFTVLAKFTVYILYYL